MTRADALLLAGLLAALPARAGEALDPEFLAFLADEAQDAREAATAEQDPELVAWLRDWWNPADDAGHRTEKTP